MIVRGHLSAVSAAICNATVGVMTGYLFILTLDSNNVAFFKCLVAWLFTGIIIVSGEQQRKTLQYLIKHWWRFALAAFFGVFTLYYFETHAYSYCDVSSVVFALLASSTLASFASSKILFEDRVKLVEWVCISLAIVGLSVFLFYGGKHAYLSVGVLYAMVAGIGYGLFLTINKVFKLSGTGIVGLWLLLSFSLIYLAVPLLITNTFHLPSLHSLPILLLLGILPTIGGFYFTMRALHSISVTEAQLCELLEPLFASVLAFFFLKQNISGPNFFGGILIISSILILITYNRFFSNKLGLSFQYNEEDMVK